MFSSKTFEGGMNKNECHYQGVNKIFTYDNHLLNHNSDLNSNWQDCIDQSNHHSDRNPNWHDCIDQSPDKTTIHSYLKLVHHQSISKKIANSDLINKWLSVIIDMAISSNYHVGIMLKQRSDEYGNKPCFNIILFRNSNLNAFSS